MNILIVLVPAALLLGILGLGAFFWCLRTQQFDDPDGAARRILDPAVDGREVEDQPNPAKRHIARR